MKYIKGDLLDLFDRGEFDIIVHGCNCRKTMKSGIAGQIVKKYPIVAARDQMTTDDALCKLGSVDFIHLPYDRIIVNAYTQLNYGRDENVTYVNYAAIESCFQMISAYITNLQRLTGKIYRVGIPKIGCGLANGDWEIVKARIKAETKFLDITVVEYENT